ncbi:hypothetical protein [Herbihabitans rhizosphaerae]|uniref:hypothetical protein n=1 Tax=Herbihabitans rhizosphaerae TaxID=1872711 RepID=UPI0013EEE898|nr:hypothetical protein [Herbihabitans rhizosphaerae]
MSTISVAVVPLVAGCSFGDNKLRRASDSDEPVAAASPSTTSTPPVPAAAPVRVAPPPRLDRFALTEADLAGEGLTRAGEPVRMMLARLDDCGAPLGAARESYRASWRYPTGATVLQYLALHPGGADAIVRNTRGALACGRFRLGGNTFRVETPFRFPGDDPAGLSWCAVGERETTCTSLVARGEVLSVLTVSAPAAARARAALIRLAPRAASALDRV